MARFVGRENELKTLEDLARKRSASLVVIRGRRRIGKSRLVEELATRHPFKGFYRFSGLPPTKNTTAQSQRDVFAGQLMAQFGSSLELTGSHAQDWATLFLLLAEKIREGKVLLLFDEISWMGSKDPDFLGKLKNAWDVHFKKNDQLIFVICGSVSTWIEKNILSSSGYLGRVSLDLILKELPLEVCTQFWEPYPSQTSSYEKLKVLSVTGGVPLYLEHIRPELSSEENITALCFRQSGLLFREFDNIFSDLFSKRSTLYKKIIEALAGGPLSQQQLCDHIGQARSNTIALYLDDLITSGFVIQDQTWNLQTGHASKLSRYRICDCYSRFYLKFIKPNKHKIQQDQFRTRSISALSQWSAMIGLQFEILVLNNRHKIWQKIMINPEEIIFDNPYFQQQTKRHQACQVDYLIQTKFHTVYLCEIKFSQREIGLSIVDEIQEKIKRLALPKHVSYRPVLIHVNGVTEEVQESGYFASIINFSDLLEMR